MNMSDVLGFWVVSVVFVIAPGSDWAYAISAGLRGRVAIPAVGGMLAGHLAATVLVAAGVGALVAGAPGLLGGLTLVGGAYLLWLGFMTFTRPVVAPRRGRRGVVGRTVAVEGVRGQRPQPEGAPADPRAAAAVHLDVRAVAGLGADPRRSA